ncbi:MAG: DUF1538 domain-containing protein [Clostridiales bacterium]|nr:DUF1538 domain-containing protein [Clostridiales bacterium]
MNLLFEKFKEVFYSILPITVIVTVMYFIPGTLTNIQLARFFIGAACVTIGLSIFLLGVDIGITPLGSHVGTAMSKSNKLLFVIIIGLILGFFISIAEPDLQILSQQVESVTAGAIKSSALLMIVSIGVAIMLALGFIRMVLNFPLYIFLTVAYGVILILAVIAPPEFRAISFDSSGATTGALAVPFILALTVGVSALKKDSKASEKDSFGLVAIVSTGAIISVLLMGIFKNITGLYGSADALEESNQIIAPFLHQFIESLEESFIALLPLTVIFIVFQLIILKLNRRAFSRIMKGLIYTLIGLTLFMTGVNSGFMGVGTALGEWIGDGRQIWAVLLGLLLGIVTVLAEPAVHVLTHQIENVTAGYVKRNIVMLTLAVGVGFAVALSIVRVLVEPLQLWHYLLPGYIISIALSFFIPKLFVGIAFDSGGVASGPMTTTFILAFAQGVAKSVPGADVLRDAFGMIALVAMAPIITLELLGLLYKIKTRKHNHEDGA